MIRTVALNELQDDEGAQDWLDANYPDPAVTALLARVLKPRWGVSNEWFAERFMFGDATPEQVAADLTSFSGEAVLPSEVGAIATYIASELVKQRRHSIGS